MKRSLVMALLLLTACGEATGGAPSTQATTGPSHAIVLQADLVGGCFMMGPNCVRYVVRADGTVDAYRLGEGEPEHVWTSSIDAVLTRDLVGAIAATDLEALPARLDPGTCMACVDGIDTVATVFTAAGAGHTFDSAVVSFDPSLPLFAALSAVLLAAAATGEIPVVSR